MRFPSIQSVAAHLIRVKEEVDGYDDCAVRLRVAPNGNWEVLLDDPCYDTDHRGYWGASSISHRSNCRELAKELLEQAKDHYAEASTSHLPVATA